MLFQILMSHRFNPTEIIISVLASLAVVFLTMPIHEAAHAYTADKLGDPTARFQGRLSLNPFRHLDLFGALSIIFFGFGWAKAVPVNTSYFKNPKRDMAITAIAGPVSNLLVAFVLMLVNNIIRLFVPVNNISFMIYRFFDIVIILNIHLAVFNLIPIPPLDGSRLLTAILPTKQYYMLMRYEQYFFIVLIVLLFTGVLDIPLSFLSSKITDFLSMAANLPFIFFNRR